MESADNDVRRLAIFLPSLEVGGAETVAVSLANGMLASKVDVTVLLAKAEGPLLSQLAPGIKVHELGGRGVAHAIFPLSKYLRKERPHSLFSMMTHANVAALLGVRLAGRNKTRVVISERMSLAARKAYYTSATERALLLAMRLLYHGADAIVVPSCAMQAEYSTHLRCGYPNIQVIPNPVVDGRFRYRASEPWHLGEEIKRQGGKLVVAVGRLSGVKDFATLIEAVAGIPAAAKVHLVILGEGEERGALEALIDKYHLSDRVHLSGFCPNPLPAMRHADVYVLSSRFEGLPNSLIQALACGARVVSTDCPTGPSEILEEGKWGLLVPVGDANAMRNGIIQAMNAKTWPETTLRCGEFEIDSVISRYLSTLFPAPGRG